MLPPALNPSNILSLIKFTRELNLKRKAIKHNAATTSAVSAAIAAQRCKSPPASVATVVPIIREVADVGPTATCCEVVKKANNNPPARQQ